MVKQRSTWLAVRAPLSGQASFWSTVVAFLLPLAVWSVVSYVPFGGHSQVLVTDAGDASVPGAHSYLPAPHEVGKALVTAFTTPPERTGDVWLHESLWHSCQLIFGGFVYACFFALPIGILCGTFTLVSRLLEPVVDFVRYVPAPVFGALAVAVLGVADVPKVTIIFIGTFFQMVLVVSNTTRQVDVALLHAAQTLGAKSWQLVRHVVIPGALPNLYRDMRVLLGWAWTYLVVAELIGDMSGVSAFIYQQQRSRHFDNVYAAIIMIGLIGFASDQVLAIVGKYLFPWESGSPALPRFVRGVEAAFTATVAPKPASEAV
jgi:NitT/TauT family transport system permease protein